MFPNKKYLRKLTCTGKKGFLDNESRHNQTSPLHQETFPSQKFDYVYLPFKIYRYNSHKSPSVWKNWNPVENPLSNVCSINQSFAVKLRPEITEKKNGRRSDATCQNVDDDQECKSGSSIVGKETEGIRERNSKETKQDDE